MASDAMLSTYPLFPTPEQNPISQTTHLERVLKAAELIQKGRKKVHNHIHRPKIQGYQVAEGRTEQTLYSK